MLEEPSEMAFLPVKFHVKLINLQKPILVQCVVNEGSRLEVVETGDKDCLFSRRQMWHFPHNFVCIWSVLYASQKMPDFSLSQKMEISP